MKWKTVDFAPRYRVSENGDVWDKVKGKIKPPFHTKDGYLRINMINIDGVNKKYLIHSLVCWAFNTGHFRGAVVHHLDFDKHNNYFKNLEWTTVRTNSAIRKERKEALA